MTQSDLSAPSQLTDGISEKKSEDYVGKQSETQKKSEVYKTIKELSSKKVDFSGNKVTNIFAIGNEYVIYEIEADDVNDKLKVFIDGFSDESEKILTTKFARVKTKYTEAKGLLYRSKNFGNMKNRIAHTLSSVLVLDDIDGNVEFQRLIDEIKKENQQAILNKMMHVWPSFLFFAIMSLICIMDGAWSLPRNEFKFNVYMVLFSASLGGSLSILYSIYKIRFDEIANVGWYIVSGLERVILSIVTGTIAFVFIKSKIVLQLSNTENYWALMTILILASFSETFIPSMIGKIESKSKSP